MYITIFVIQSMISTKIIKKITIINLLIIYKILNTNMFCSISDNV